jgi:hypothetical protein
MAGPNLYERYDRWRAVALFGDESSALSLCDSQWLIFPNAVVCLTAVGDPPRMSHFTSASQFFWVADRPYRVNLDKYIYFVPKEVVRTGGEGTTDSSVRAARRRQSVSLRREPGAILHAAIAGAAESWHGTV